MSVLELGRTLRSARGDRSLREIAAASGVSHAMVAKLEIGSVARPGPDVLRAVAGALDVDYARVMREAGYL